MRITLKNLNAKTHFVPKHEPINKNDIEKLSLFLEDKPNILVLTGAGIKQFHSNSNTQTFLIIFNHFIKGISTESGIPDYRSEGVGLYARTNHKPVQHMDFVKSKDLRQRYWARNYVGWPKFSAIEPNVTHFTLSKMEKVSDESVCL
jgi:NAD+-dependent protein deacetylase sirtuin 4